MKPERIKKGDTIAIVSLSSGIAGEEFISHEIEIGIKRLKNMGFEVKFMPNSLKGMKYLDEHPEKRAQDFLDAFEDKKVKAIISAIGGEDTYRLIPYLFEDKKFEEAVKNNPKIFLGFSDSTVNHFMLNKIGLNSFYGQAFLPDIAELDTFMLPYTKRYFENLFLFGKISEINASPIWYYERKSFDKQQIGTKRVSSKEDRGFEVLKGSGNFSGKILGGCIETINDMISTSANKQSAEIIKKYDIFPKREQWKENILLLETSETQSDPEKLKDMLYNLKNIGLFDEISGVIVGKPMDEKYYDEYKKVYEKVLEDKDISVVYNINVGHCTPRCIIPFGVKAQIRGYESRIVFKEDIF